MTNEVGTVLSPPRPRIREITIAAAIADLAVFLWSLSHLSSRRGLSLLLTSTIAGVFGLLQFAREYSILRHCGTAIEEVVDYRDLQSGFVPVERHGRPNYIRYRFATRDGMFYHGQCSTSRVPTALGSPIEIVYDRRNPSRNLPCSHIFFYTGLAIRTTDG